MRYARFTFCLIGVLFAHLPLRSIAQVPPSDVKPPSQQPLPEQAPPAPLPPVEQLLPSVPVAPSGNDLNGSSASLVVNRYEVVGSTVFSRAELEAVTKPFTTPSLGKAITFAQMLQARSAVTQLYIDRGYVTSGAIIPPQPIKDGVVIIQAIEGKLDKINVTGTRRLAPGYVSSRLAIATQAPLNQNRLLEALQLLQLNPLIQSISADLQAGTRPGTNILEVKVVEAKTFAAQIGLDNDRSPSVGTVRRRVALTQANLLGFGDAVSIGYINTNGSNGVDVNYVVPVSPRNTTLSFAFSATRSRVIEKPFDVLDISANSTYAEFTVRQPILQKPTQELALGLTLSHQFNQTFLGIDDIGGFPLSQGADDRGRTRTSAIRFFQEWNQRSSQHVLALRSQFSLGVGALNATINRDAPDSRFFTWRGQAQWVRALAPDTIVLLRGDVQLSDRPLLGLEQFGLGGAQSVRGYRRDLLLVDNGVFGSVEVRVPILRVPQLNGVLQLTPFVEVGRGWNRTGNNPDPNTLAGAGIGLLWRQGNTLSARLNWGIPLISINSERRTWQENGVYFSIDWTPF